MIKVDTDYSSNSVNFYLNGTRIYPKYIMSNEGKHYYQYTIDLSEITIKSWNYLREETNNYFSVDINKIGERIKSPNKLIIEVEGQTKELSFDVIDKYNMNINYKFNSVLNEGEIKNKIEIKEW